MPLPLLPIAAGVVGAGALGSALGGYTGASHMNNNINSANQGISTLQGQLQGQGDTINQIATDAYSPLTQNFDSDMGAYRDLANQGQTFQYQNVDPFAYDLNAKTQSFLDPSMDFQIQQATDQLQGSAANAGKLFSGATGQAIADRSQEIAQQSWKDALQTALADRGFQADQYRYGVDRGDRGVEFEAQQYNNDLARQADILGTLTGMGADATMNLAGHKIDSQRDVFQGMNDLELQKLNNLLQKQDTSFGATIGNLLSGGASTAGALAPIFTGGK